MMEALLRLAAVRDTKQAGIGVREGILPGGAEKNLP